MMPESALLQPYTQKLIPIKEIKVDIKQWARELRLKKKCRWRIIINDGKTIIAIRSETRALCMQKWMQ